jgi:hypothetical protein
MRLRVFLLAKTETHYVAVISDIFCFLRPITYSRRFENSFFSRLKTVGSLQLSKFQRLPGSISADASRLGNVINKIVSQVI